MQRAGPGRTPEISKRGFRVQGFRGFGVWGDLHPVPLQIEYRALGADLVALVLVVMAGQKTARGRNMCKSYRRDTDRSSPTRQTRYQCSMHIYRPNAYYIAKEPLLPKSNMGGARPIKPQSSKKTSLKPPTPPPPP